MNVIELFKQPDKRKHALLCAAAAAFSALMALVAVHVAYGAAAWLTGVALAFGYEALQKYRGEGEASKEDAIAGVIGATLVALALLALEFGTLPG